MPTQPIDVTFSSPASPAEVLWHVQKDGRSYSCELRSRGERAIEGRILLDGTERLTRRFQQRDIAMLWAAIEREEL